MRLAGWPNLLGRAIFEAERVCATLAALFPSRHLCVFETLATPGRAQPPSYLKEFSSPGDPLVPDAGKHAAHGTRKCFDGRVCVCVCVCEGASSIPRGGFLSGRYRQTLWHQGSAVGRSSFSLNRPGPSPHSRLGPRDVSISPTWSHAMSGCTRQKSTSALGKGIERLDADRPCRDEHDVPLGGRRGLSRPVSGRFILAIPSSGSQCCRRDNPWCYSRRDSRRRGGWAGTGGWDDGIRCGGPSVASQGASSHNLAISKSGQIGP